MNSTLIRQIIAVILWIVLLVGMLLIHVSIAGAYPTHTGIMLIAPPYQIA